MTVKNRFLSVALATLTVMSPAAFAQDGSGILWREYDGRVGVALALFFFGNPTGPYAYATGRESGDREASKIKDKDKYEVETTLYAYDDWWELGGLGGEVDLNDLAGTMTTKNNKSYKVANFTDGDEYGDFTSWVADYIEALGSESADVSEASMKGKFKLDKQGNVKFKLLIKYLGTTTSGDNFNGKAKGKIKFKGVLEEGAVIE